MKRVKTSPEVADIKRVKKSSLITTAEKI